MKTTGVYAPLMSTKGNRLSDLFFFLFNFCDGSPSTLHQFLSKFVGVCFHYDFTAFQGLTSACLVQTFIYVASDDT